MLNNSRGVIRKKFLAAALAGAGLFAMASVASAAVDKVRAVPWQGDPVKQHTAISSQGIKDLWHTATPNDLRITKTTTNTYVSWVRAKFTTGGSTNTVCLYDNTGSGCTNMYLCAGYTNSAFDQTTTVAASPAPDSVVLEVLNTCYSGDTINLSINGTLLGGVAANQSGQCTCTPPLETTDPKAANAALLKGVITTTDTNQIWYKWVFGDGSESAIAALSGSTQYNVEATHVYSAAVGTPFTALLQAADNDAVSNPVTSSYLIKVEADNLDSRVNISIDKGLWYLYKTVTMAPGNTYPYYSFNGQPVAVWAYSSYFASPTAASVLAFEVNNHKESGNPNVDPYVEVVKGGLNWLLNGQYYYDPASYGANQPQLRAYGIGAQALGNPDTNGNGIGIDTLDWGYNPAYEGGMVMDAIVASGTPAKSTGRIFTGTTAHTYADVVQDMADMYAWGQYDDVNYGGWRYSWNSWPDNSACQWAAIGMLAAEREWGLTIPQWVKTANNGWLNYSYNAGSRWFGYSYYGDCAWPNCQATRPSGMVQMVLSTPNYQTDSRWTGAEGWHADNWDWFRDNAYYYGKYSFVKSMRLSGTQNLSSGLDWYRGSASQLGLAQSLINGQAGDGHWEYGIGTSLDTPWVIAMLKPTLFAASPIACFTAAPNPSYPDQDIYFNPSCSGHSETGKSIADLVRFEWDFNNDGTYEQSTPTPAIVTHQFACAALPCTYPVHLRVTDNSTPARTATAAMDIRITNPPHPPVAKAGGPYMVSLCGNDSLRLDGSASYDPDQGQHEAGCNTCPNDTITAWGWDLVPPLTQFTDASGATVTVNPATYFTAGSHDIGLRVTDNTALAYPGSGQPNLTGTDFGKVNVQAGCICNLTARPKSGKVQITWTPGASGYDIYRSTAGPNTGFALIAGNVATTYATYLDSNVVNGTKYWYRVVVRSTGCGSNAASATATAR